WLSTTTSTTQTQSLKDRILNAPITYPPLVNQALINAVEKRPEVCVGLSGGVDSAITAYMLKKKGFKVTCVFIKSWDEKDELGYCSGEKDFADAQDIAKRLDLPLHHADFVKEYWNRVFKSFLEEYNKGYTPNPDVFCNREIKFDVFYDYARSMGIDMIATGHYARLNYLDGQHTGQAQLLRGVDPSKDQSYFLCMTEGFKLNRSLFPLGNCLKSDAVALANELGYHNLTTKRSSRGICFIGKRPLDEFLGAYIDLKPGFFVDHNGDRISKHKGAICYTIGQKANISSLGERYFIYKVDPVKNQVHVCPESRLNVYLYSNTVKIHRVNWITGVPPQLLTEGGRMRIRCQVRYRADMIGAEIITQAGVDGDGPVYTVKLDQPERGVAPGQILCMFKENSEVCLGGGAVGLVVTTTDVLGPLAHTTDSFPTQPPERHNNHNNHYNNNNNSRHHRQGFQKEER
ncbi:hypothetical protein SAMD00019534_029100, partial [Acytostelium subglobosum LB1]|uniref:hypothetical protein n=1 Tax=Acytostelium subglobosum LB1 TaxID=1410327 RepID=UPI000644ECC0